MRITTNPNANIKIGATGSCVRNSNKFSKNNGYCAFSNWKPSRGPTS